MGYDNNLRLLEIATGAESGTWGTKTNTNLGLIADAFGSGTEAISGTTHTTTVADGAADEGRAIYLKYTGALGANNTITLAPNDLNKFWIIENATTDSGSSGPYSIIISQGSGANITIGNGKVAAIFTDGAGSGAAVLDAFADLELSTTLTVGTDLDVDGTTNLDAVDIDGAVQIDSTVTVGVDDTGYDVKFFGDTASAYMLWDTSTDDLVLAGAAGIDLAGDLDVDGTANLDIVDIDGAVDMASTLGVSGTSTLAAINATGNLAVTGLATVTKTGSSSNWATVITNNYDSSSDVSVSLAFANSSGRNSGIGVSMDDANSGEYLISLASGGTTRFRVDGAGDVEITATQKLYLDGGGDTYIVEGSSNLMQFYASGSEMFRVADTYCYTPGDFYVAATKKIYLDGGGNTYIYESSADVIRFYSGGTENISLSSDDVMVPSAGKIYHDGGVDTYTTLISNNIIGWYCGNTEAMRLTDGTCTITGDIKIPATNKIYLDGGSDTYIVESSANVMDFHTSALAISIDGNQNVKLRATRKLYFDDGSDTYIQGEVVGNQLDFVTSGVLALRMDGNGNVSIPNGALSKESGTFKIDHPLPEKKDTHYLVHSFHEGPRADLSYRGEVALESGSATVNLDDSAGMTEGTWELLCRDPQCWIQNDSGWDAVRGSVEGNTLTIECADSDSSDSVSWMVVAERCDPHMYDTNWTDDDGRPIIEPEKSEPEEEEE